uniref:Uncharacterized protein n=1 Tax=Arundo donax TaxID=35708 RepID=A0A0A9FE47_ARUDO
MNKSWRCAIYSNRANLSTFVSNSSTFD